MHRCEPIRCHTGQVERAEGEKDIRQETVCGGLEGASWRLNKMKRVSPVHKFNKRIGGKVRTSERPTPRG